ncbi:hypothetical protein LguiA_034182 [Lonicera macranthoides]
MIMTNLGVKPLVIQIPIGFEDMFESVIDLVKMEVVVWTEGELGSKYEFKSEIKERAVPKEYIPGIIKGLEECLSSGVLTGFPVVNVRAVLVEGSSHDVDSSEMAFKLAAYGAYRERMKKVGPNLLEPIMRVEVVTSKEHLGDVIDDLNLRI